MIENLFIQGNPVKAVEAEPVINRSPITISIWTKIMASAKYWRNFFPYKIDSFTNFLRKKLFLQSSRKTMAVSKVRRIVYLTRLNMYDEKNCIVDVKTTNVFAVIAKYIGATNENSNFVLKA